MNAMDAEVTHLRILANLKTREIVPQFSNSPPTSVNPGVCGFRMVPYGRCQSESVS